MAKDSPRTTAGELQKIVESRGQKNKQKKKNCQTAPTSPCCLGGFQEKFSLLIQKQTPAYSVMLDAVIQLFRWCR